MKHQKLCADLEEMLAVSHPEEDLSPSEYAALKEHLAHCSECAAIRERYVLMTTYLRALSAAKPVSSNTPELIRLREKIAVPEKEAARSSFPSQPRGKQEPKRGEFPERAVGSGIAAIIVTLMLALIALVLFQRHALTAIAAISKVIATSLASISASAFVFSITVTGCIVVLMAIYHFRKKEGRKLGRIVAVAASAVVLLTVAANLAIGAIEGPATNGSPTPGGTSTPILKPIPNAPAPTNQSLLVVLLDRSGSLIQGSSATDPNGYSTSVTKALADLWPGKMAVIPFSGDTQSLPILGLYTLSDPTQLSSLKEKVQNYPVGGDTPLGPAMQEALGLLGQHGNPPGSRVVIITDGTPTGIGNNDGPHQMQNIRNNLVPRFCNQGIPINVFGLMINLSTPDGQETNQLFLDMTQCTGGTYTNVQSAASLTTSFIKLYAQWKGLSLIQENAQSGNFQVPIDPFAEQVEIVTFRSTSNDRATLVGPNGQLIQGLVQSSDRHYEIDILPSTFTAGTYTVHINGHSSVQVYALINSSLRVQLETPTLQSTAHGESIEIAVTFLDGKNPLTPEQGQAQVVAHVKLIVDGQQSGPTRNVILVQQGAKFIGQVPAYEQAGEVAIEIEGSYYGTQRTTSTSLQSVTPCSLGTLQCFWVQHQPGEILAGLFAAILPLLLILIALFQPTPFGYLHSNVNDAVDIALKALPRFPVRLVRKSIIKTADIRNYVKSYKDFPFGAAKFDIIFKRGGKAFIRPAKNSYVSIEVWTSDDQDILHHSNKRGSWQSRGALNQARLHIEIEPGELKELPFGSVIVVNGKPVVSFEKEAAFRRKDEAP